MDILNKATAFNGYKTFNKNKNVSVISINDLNIQAKMTPYIRGDICSYFPSRPNYTINYSKNNISNKDVSIITKQLLECDTLFIRKIKKELKSKNLKLPRNQTILTAQILYAKQFNSFNIIHKPDWILMEKISFNQGVKNFVTKNNNIINYYSNKLYIAPLLKYNSPENICKNYGFLEDSILNDILKYIKKISLPSSTNHLNLLTSEVNSEKLSLKKIIKNAFSSKEYKHSLISNKTAHSHQVQWNTPENIVYNINDDFNEVTMSYILSLEYNESSTVTSYSIDSEKDESYLTVLAVNYTKAMIKNISDLKDRTGSNIERGGGFKPRSVDRVGNDSFGCVDGIMDIKEMQDFKEMQDAREIHDNRNTVRPKNPNRDSFMALSHMYSLKKLLGKEIAKTRSSVNYAPFKPEKSNDHSDSERQRSSSALSLDSFDQALIKKFTADLLLTSKFHIFEYLKK